MLNKIYEKKWIKKQNYQLLKAQKNFKTYKDDNNIIHTFSHIQI